MRNYRYHLALMNILVLGNSAVVSVKKGDKMEGSHPTGEPSDPFINDRY